MMMATKKTPPKTGKADPAMPMKPMMLPMAGSKPKPKK